MLPRFTKFLIFNRNVLMNVHKMALSCNTDKMKCMLCATQLRRNISNWAFPKYYVVRIYVCVYVWVLPYDISAKYIWTNKYKRKDQAKSNKYIMQKIILVKIKTLTEAIPNRWSDQIYSYSQQYLWSQVVIFFCFVLCCLSNACVTSYRCTY